MTFHNYITIDTQETHAKPEIIAQDLRGKAATLAHLRALGVGEGEEFWIKLNSNRAVRCVMAVDNFIAQETRNVYGEDGKALKDEKGGTTRDLTQKHSDGYSFIARCARYGAEVYFIVNKVVGGITANHVESVRAVFFESDKSDLWAQLARISDIEEEFGLVPSAVVYSGGKSVHCFYKVTGCDIESFKAIQRQLIIIADGDQNIQNVNREMRIAGFDRKSKGKHQKLIIAHSSEYTAEEITSKLSAKFPQGMTKARFDAWSKRGDEVLTVPEEEITPQTTTKRTARITVEEIEAIKGLGGFPLMQALTKRDRELIYNGSTEGTRHKDNHYLATNLVATARFLETEGVSFTGDIQELLQQHGDRCFPPLDQTDIDRHWQRGHDKLDASPSLPADEIRARVENWVSANGENDWKTAYTQKVNKVQRELYDISPYITQRLNARYLPEELFDDLPLGLNIIASIPGTGKTFGTRKIVKDNKSGNVFSYRNSLCQQFAANTGADFVWGNGTESVEVLRGRWDKVNTWSASSIESIIKFPPKPILVLEEVSKVVESMVTGSTCRQFRTQIMEKFQEHLRFASKIICLDADIRAVDIKYLQELSEHKAHLIVNEYRKGGWACSFLNVEGKPRSKKAIDDSLIGSVAEGKKVFVVSDAKATLNNFYRRFKKSVPEDKILLIDGDRVTDKCPRVSEFLKDPSAWIEANQPQIILGSPTIESSVSVDSHGYFNEVYGLFYGVINHQSVIQMLARLRDNEVPRKIHIAPYAKITDEGSRSPLPERVRETLSNDHAETLNKLGLVGEVGTSQTDLLRKLAAILNPKSDVWINPHIAAFTAYKAMRNHSMGNLGELLRRDLLERGHTIEEVNSDQATLPDHELKIEAAEYREEKAGAIANAAEVPLALADEKRKDPQATLKEHYEYQRAYWVNRLPGFNLTAEFIDKFILQDKNFIPAIERRWIINNPQVILDRDTKKVPKAVEDGRQLWDVRSYAPLLEAAEKLDIVSLLFVLLDESVTWTAETVWLDEVLKRGMSCRKLMISVFGVSLHKNYDKCKLLRTILEKFGYMVKTIRKRAGGVQKKCWNKPTGRIYAAKT
ncbi:MAG: plasmid replication protein, CyRepA1 family [Aulosira sp. DedQUE10]|nr:plasmid replication protein, CyRepA1 family [Aulosira sp. DedQUE10]